MKNQKNQTSEAAVREIRRRTRRTFSREEKIRIALEGLGGLGGKQSVSELCLREGIASNLYCRWRVTSCPDKAGGLPIGLEPSRCLATLRHP
jgi:transposase-like protein